MKAKFAYLTIDAYGSRFDNLSKKTPNNLSGIKIAAIKSFCPSDATQQEKRIHEYLDENNIYLIDIK